MLPQRLGRRVRERVQTVEVQPFTVVLRQCLGRCVGERRQAAEVEAAPVAALRQRLGRRVGERSQAIEKEILTHQLSHHLNFHKRKRRQTVE